MGQQTQVKFNCLIFICRGRDNRWGYFQCDCDSITCIVLKKICEVKAEKVKSCGCYLKRFGPHNKTHGESNITSEHKIWKSIRKKCRDENLPLYDRWNNYLDFLEDVGRKPSDKHKFIRINSGKGYYPDNCKWINNKDIKQQSRKLTTGWSDWKIEYRSWVTMKARCTDPNKDNYFIYGGAGITVCEQWLGEDGFKNFCKDMGHRPDISYTLHRKKNELGYFPENCMWLKHRAQTIHRRSSRFIQYKDYNFNMSTWAEILDINYGTFKKYIYKGKSIEEILSTLINDKLPRTPEKYLEEFNDRILENYPEMREE